MPLSSLEVPFGTGTDLSASQDLNGAWTQSTLPGKLNASGVWVPHSITDPVPVESARLLGTREFGAYYAARGQRFSTTTGYQAHNLNASAGMAALVNPADSGKWVFFDELEFGAIGADSRFTRFGGGTVTPGVSAVPLSVASTSGHTQTVGTAQEGKLKAYIPNATANLSYTATGGTVRKVAPMANARPYFVFSRGRAIMRPGTVMYWTTAEPVGGGNGVYDAYINFEWVEIPTAQAEAIVTEAQLRPH